MFPTTGTRLSRRPPRYVGANLTANSITVTNQVMVGNSTVNTAANSTHFFSGNATVFGFSNSTAEGIANSTGNCVTTPLSIYFQTNTTANSIHSNAALTFNSNSTQNSTVNSTTYSFNYPGASVVRPFTSVLMANNGLSANSNSTVQAVFPTGQKTLTLAATTAYLIDAVYIISNASSTGVGAGTSLQTSFGNSAAIGTLFYESVTFVQNSTSVTTTGNIGTTNAATTVSLAMGVTANVFATLKGTIATVGAVNITPQVSFAAATNSTPQILTGSYITFTPISNTTAGTCNSYGTWA